MMLEERQLSSQSCAVSRMIHGTFTDLSVVKSVVMTTEVQIIAFVFNRRRTSEVEKQSDRIRVDRSADLPIGRRPVQGKNISLLRILDAESMLGLKLC